MNFRSVYILIFIFSFSSCSNSIRFAENSRQNEQKQIKAVKKNYKAAIKVESEPELTKIIRERKRNSHPELNPIVAEATEWIGTPYCYGGEDKNCTDCSGFVMQIFAHYGVRLPRTAAQQFMFANKISAEESKPGDLVFFSDGNSITHVGIFAGNGEFIHASSSKGVIRTSLLKKYYRRRFSGFARVIEL